MRFYSPQLSLLVLRNNLESALVLVNRMSRNNAANAGYRIHVGVWSDDGSRVQYTVAAHFYVITKHRTELLQAGLDVLRAVGDAHLDALAVFDIDGCGVWVGQCEAAELDGASKWQQIFKITIPLLKPTIVMLTLLAIGRIFYSDFGLFYQVPQNQGALFSVTNTIDTYVYRGLLELGDMSMSSAAGLYQSLVGFILVLGSNLIVKKIDPDYALF